MMLWLVALSRCSLRFWRRRTLLVLILQSISQQLFLVQSWNFPIKATRRDVFQATLASFVTTTTTSGGLITNNDKSHAMADESIVTTNRLPHLMSEYYHNRPDTAPSAGRSYFPTLTPPFTNRATFRYDLGRGAWALEQLLTFGNVTATIRTNVIRLQNSKNGGLWVHSPQWPTGELCQLLDDLGGPVEHIVLPCNALEHKAPMKAFVQKYPQASVWIAPGQYGLFGSCGKDLTEPCNMGYRVDGILSQPSSAALSSSSSLSSSSPPWLDEFDYCTLYVDLPQNSGPVSEVAFYHRPTTTLIVTDALVFIPPQPSPIFRTYFDDQTMADASFWPKTVLQSVFLPLRTTTTSNFDDDHRTVVYPGYQALENRLVRAPILRAFNDARAPTLTRAWIRQIATQWKDIDRILTSHFASPIAATANDVIRAFSYLNDDISTSELQRQQILPPIACQDWQLLDGLNQFITNNNLGAPVVFEYQRGCVK